jgi:threonine dehydrogenase-like Zn-dependent dehydrogenase
MRGIVFRGEREIEVRELRDPEPGPGEVVIAMKASGLCGSDLKIYRATRDSRGGPASLKVGGHEPCGVIAQVGAGVTDLRPGDRVMMHHYSGCGECKMCLAGYTQMCVVHHEVYGYTRNGGHADYLLSPASACIPLPEELSFGEGAAYACGSGTAFQALRRLGVAGGDTLAVFGQGPVGLSATLFGAAMGARVLAVDVVPERLELSSRLGADEVIDASGTDAVGSIRELTQGQGADATLDATGLPGPRNDAVDAAGPWGRVCFVGEGGATTFNISRQIIHKQLTLHGSWTFSTGGLAEVACFVAEHQVPLDKLITHRFALAEASEAYRLFDTARTGKVVLVWP